MLCGVAQRPLALFRGHAADGADQRGIRGQVHGPVLERRTRWIMAQVVARFPVAGWPDGSCHKASAAIGAHVVPQNMLNTGAAKSAFITADARFIGVGGQGFVAVLAAGSEFKHDGPV